MSLRQPAAARPSPTPDPALERIQREHELNAALEAARTLQARLELLGDRPDDVRFVRQLRDALADDIHRLGSGGGRSAVPGLLQRDDDDDLVSSQVPLPGEQRRRPVEVRHGR